MPQHVTGVKRSLPKGTKVQWWISSSVPQNAVVVRADRARDMSFIRTEFGREHWAYNEDLSREGE